jgi:hypothetical protein
MELKFDTVRGVHLVSNTQAVEAPLILEHIWSCSFYPSHLLENHNHTQGWTSKGWFDSLHKRLRIQYNSYFDKTHGLFNKTQLSPDVTWIYRNPNRWALAYLPLLDSSSSEDVHNWWIVDFYMSSASFFEVPLMLIALLAMGWPLLRWYRRGITVRPLLALSILVVVIPMLYWKPEQLLVFCSILFGVVLLAFLTYALPSLAAHRLHIFGARREDANPNQDAKDFNSEQGAVNHYEPIWRTFDNSEKLALFHLAKTGFLSSKHAGLFSLIEKGWIIPRLGLELAGRTFRDFVLSKEDIVIRLEEQASDSFWDRFAWPVGAVLLIGLAGLIYTQQDLLTSMSAFVGILAALFPLTSKLLDVFKSGKSAPLPSES